MHSINQNLAEITSMYILYKYKLINVKCMQFKQNVIVS